MMYDVTDIEFETHLGTGIKEEYAISFEEEIALRDSALGVWEADNEDDMIDEITTATGYLINNIYFDIQLK